MMSYKIFCEGITDQIFIADCITVFYNFTYVIEHKKKDNLKITFSNGIEIIDVGGCTKLSDELYLSLLEDNKDCGGTNIIIFDADHKSTGKGNKGYESCLQKLNDIKKNHNVEFIHYIWPNNSDDGIIENLLRKLIPNEKETIYQCIESHHSCLSSLSIDNVRIAELKEKVGYYLYTVNQDSKPGKRNYKDSNYWDLDCNKIPDLLLFKTFLDIFFKN